MEILIRRLRALATDHRAVAHHRTMSVFGAWQALDDDPILLCDCGEEDCPHRSP